MAEQWIGFTVSINCGSVLGTFRGVIVRVEASDQSITLRNVDRNGEPCTSREITIKYIQYVYIIVLCLTRMGVLFRRASDIKDLEILQRAFLQEQQAPPPVFPTANSAFHSTAPGQSNGHLLSPMRRETPRGRPNSSGEIYKIIHTL